MSHRLPRAAAAAVSQATLSNLEGRWGGLLEEIIRENANTIRI